MSAIWGIVQKNEIMQASAHMMRTIYSNTCRLDQIKEQSSKNQLFGCGLQYITDESKNEQLPIYNRQLQLFFTADCILDNREELLTQLAINDHSTPDGTIMYLGYLKWGASCVSHFKGLYSLAVYEEGTNTLFLATDPTACRCLYYYPHAAGCTFSTLLKPLLHAHPNLPTNELYLQDFLIAPGLRPNISATETPYKEVYKLEAGTYVLIRNGKKEVHRYWTPQTLPLSITTAHQCKDAFLSIFKNCIHNALRTYGETAIALSSGFDSSSVAVMAAKELQLYKKTLYSYTYIPYYDEDSEENEPYIITNEKDSVLKTISMYPNIQPRFLTNDGKDFYQSIDQILSIMEIPFKAFVNLPSLQEAFQASSNNNCKVFLTGQYGNATISYGDIDNILYDMYSHKHYLSYVLMLNRYCKNAKESRKRAFRGCKQYFAFTDSVLKAPSGSMKPLPDNPFLSEAFINQYPYKSRHAAEKLPLQERIALPKSLYKYCLYSPAALTYLGEYETKFGLANGILIRDPTRDTDIISFCHSIPYKFFAYHGTPRWLVRECLKDYLPKEITKPYLRYGLQNADWTYRVSQNWQAIYPLLKTNLASPAIKKYVNTYAISSFLSKNKESFMSSSYENSIYLFILDILSRFMT